EQEKYYSLKKSNHTFKTQIIVLPNGKDIVDVIAGEPGPKSDISLFRANRGCFAREQKFKGDLAYKGEDLIDTPTKKPRKRKLTQEQKQENQIFSGQRICVEHRIRTLKIFRVVQEKFR
ncbi:MAG TPA: transposase family protein, partial [Halomicronema sp.]